MKRVMIIMLIAVISCSLFAAGQAEKAEGPITIKVAEQMPEGHIMATTINYLADKIEELSNGEIKVERYVGGVLGDDTSHYEALISGAVDIIRIEMTTAVNFGAEKAAVTALPYVIRDRDHFWKMVGSDVGKDLLDSLQNDGTGFVGLAIIEEGARHFFMTTPTRNMRDLAGKKIRVQNTEFWVEIVRSLGASPTPMSFSELYQALATGVVDGAEQPLSGFVSQKFYEVCKYMILDGHVYPVQGYAFSEANWNKLSDAHKDVIRRAAAETQKYNRESIQAAEDKIMSELGGMGVTVVDVPDKSEWIKAVQPVYEKFGTPEVLDMLGRIQAIE